MPPRKWHERCASPGYVLLPASSSAISKRGPAISLFPYSLFSLVPRVTPRPFISPVSSLVSLLSPVLPQPPPSFPTITQNPSGVLTAYASGHVGMLGRELPPLLSLVHIRSRRTCTATYTHEFSLAKLRTALDTLVANLQRRVVSLEICHRDDKFAALINFQP